ncbi:MAG: phosphomannomutase/phosphoglucomutase [Candidatus Magasanikbacteria bacterium]|nr:phosphomannomutase/phosphoglucomutase [Candidatus Magasanikbacteria bacterium]
MTFPAHIFKAYDIRGLVDGELSVDLAYRVGAAFAVYLQTHNLVKTGQKVVVGYDMRPTSVPFEAAVVRAITDQGLNVVRIGLSSTPFFNFACAHYPEHAGGIIVTASHNPAEYNGFKMTLSNGLPIGKSTGMSEIRDLAGGEIPEPVAEKGEIEIKDIYPDYLAKLKSVVDFSVIKPLTIVVDAGNGMAKATLPKVLAELPTQVEYLFLEPDGTFPNHEANPLKTETLRDLQAKVKEMGADFGFALDGDADRIGLVDENGAVVDPSLVAALIGQEVLKKQSGALGLYDLRTSQIARDAWEAVGAKTDMCMVGHANIKKMMKDTGAIFASELSLHVYFGEFYDLECSDLALLYFLRLVSETGLSIGQLTAPLKNKYAHSGEINFEIQDKEGAMQAVREKFGASAQKTSDLDGVWYGFEWGWASVRTSNTEPLLRLNLETNSPELTAEKVAEFSAVLKKFE